VVHGGGGAGVRGAVGGVAVSRERLPDRRKCWTQKADIAGLKIHLTVGEYEDGRPGEVFVNTNLACAAPQLAEDFRALLACFAMAVSLGLQHGVSLEEYLRLFRGTRFVVGGIVQGSEAVKMSSSVIDYVFREMAAKYGAQA
jgi:ribonucleoside-diphosphate reductase alpha chain